MQTTDWSSRDQLELSVLGCMLLDPQAADLMLAEAAPDWFIIRELRIMFRAIDALSRTATPADPVTIAEQMLKLATLDSTDAVKAVGHAMEAVPHSAHARYYLQELRFAQTRDRARTVAESLAARAADPTQPIDDTIADAAAKLDELSGVRPQELISIADAAAAWQQEQDSPTPFLPTGWVELDKLLLGGIRPAQVVVVAARPGVGKSVVGAQIAGRAAFWGRNSLLISLEMRASQISGRLIRASRGNVDAVAAIPLTLVDSVYQIDKICSLIRMHHRRHPLGVVVVDYLQLIVPADLRIPREQQVSQCSRSLKLLANSLDLPIVLLSQLNRDADKRTGKKGRPRLSDLRESGAIEQDADTVILLHRPDTDDDEEDTSVEVIVAKQREGPTGMCTLWWDSETLSLTAAAPSSTAWAETF